MGQGMRMCMRIATTPPASPHLEKFWPQLRREQRDVLHNGQTHAPMLVLGQLLDRGQQALRQELNADDLVDLHRRVGVKAERLSGPEEVRE
eukprot:364539-Chlamydomonas_euryale.AAC.13